MSRGTLETILLPYPHLHLRTSLSLLLTMITSLLSVFSYIPYFWWLDQGLWIIWKSRSQFQSAHPITNRLRHWLHYWRRKEQLNQSETQSRLEICLSELDWVDATTSSQFFVVPGHLEASSHDNHSQRFRMLSIRQCYAELSMCQCGKSSLEHNQACFYVSRKTSNCHATNELPNWTGVSW